MTRPPKTTRQPLLSLFANGGYTLRLNGYAPAVLRYTQLVVHGTLKIALCRACLSVDATA